MPPVGDAVRASLPKPPYGGEGAGRALPPLGLRLRTFALLALLFLLLLSPLPQNGSAHGSVLPQQCADLPDLTQLHL